MATRITAYQAKDGTIFTTQREADDHDLNPTRRKRLYDYFAEHLDEPGIEQLSDDDMVDFLLEHADGLVEALARPTRKRGPNKPKVEAA